MKRPSFILANVLFVALITIILIPGRMDTPTNVPFIVATVIIEALFLWHYLPKSKRKPSSCYIVIIVWVLLIVWELVSTDLGLTHPVLIPLPENVFAVFSNKTPELMRNIKSSLTLFAEGFLTAIVVGNLLGLIVGWLPRVRETVYPIARVLAPVPAIVFTPYLIFLLPSFRMAAAMVIFKFLRPHLPKGLFYPMLLYLIINGMMNCFAWFRSMMIGGAAGWITAVGALLFFISDSSLFFVRFHKGSRLQTHFLVMLTYSLGEFLIVLGLIMG